MKMLIKGTVRFAQLGKTNKYGRYTLDVYINDETKADLLKQQLDRVVAEDEGGTYVRLNRNPEQLVFRGDQRVPAGQVRVTDTEGRTFTKIIGKGSEIACVIEVFPYTKNGGGVTHRLEDIKVIKLVEYIPAKELSFEEQMERMYKNG